MKHEYNDDSIQSLGDIEIIRKRPGMLLGSNTLDGYKHTFFEILSNSIDEAKSGFGKEIDVYYYKDYSMKVVDRGRGLPVGWNNNAKEENWKLLFCKLYAGAKYDENSYSRNLGLHGVGVCATQGTSEWTKAEIYREGYKFELEFEKGYNVGGLKKTKLKKNKNRTGTTIHWKGDLDIFTDIDIEVEYFKDIIKTQAIITPGVTFKFHVEQEDGSFDTETYFYKDGLKEHLLTLTEGSEILPPHSIKGAGRGRDRADLDDYDVDFELVFAFTDGSKGDVVKLFHNSSPLIEGSPLDAINSSFAYVFNEQIKDLGLYRKNDPRIYFGDIKDYVVVVSNSYSTADKTNYEHQTKKAINNEYVKELMNEVIRRELNIWFIENRDAVEKLVKHILNIKKKRKRNEEEIKMLKKNTVKKIDNLDNRVEKFSDCQTDDKDIRELFIVEGDSALGSVKLARDSEFQGVMPVRGKILNCLKSTRKRILKSQPIMDLVSVLGCGIEGRNFNIDELRWGKVIICTDADYDGYQIRTLIMAMFYVLMPELLNQGCIYIAETPLYEINYRKNGKDHAEFAYNEQELNQIMKKLGDTKFTIQRSKGLGENNPDMMWNTTMNPESRRLVQILMDPDDPKSHETLDILLGNNIRGRKEYIEENLSKYIEEVE